MSGGNFRRQINRSTSVPDFQAVQQPAMVQGAPVVVAVLAVVAALVVADAAAVPDVRDGSDVPVGLAGLVDHFDRIVPNDQIFHRVIETGAKRGAAIRFRARQSVSGVRPVRPIPKLLPSAPTSVSTIQSIASLR